MNYFIPPTLVRDFDAFLLTEACHDISFCHDILAQTPVWIKERAEITKNTSKQRSYDRGVKLTVSHNTALRKGDYVLYKDELYLITTNINDNQLNAKTALMELATIPFVFSRKYEDEIDDNTGMIIKCGGYRNIFGEIRGILTSNNTASYSVGTTNVGLFPKNALSVYLQANEKTFSLKIDDIFSLFDNSYIIRSILYTEINYDNTSGILILQVENTNKEAGNE